MRWADLIRTKVAICSLQHGLAQKLSTRTRTVYLVRFGRPWQYAQYASQPAREALRIHAQLSSRPALPTHTDKWQRHASEKKKKQCAPIDAATTKANVPAPKVELTRTAVWTRRVEKMARRGAR